MALVLYGGGIIDKRGSVSGSTFSRSKFGPTIRAKSSAVIVSNEATSRVRGSLQGISGSWSKDLTEPQRQSWNAFALLNPATNVFGQTSYLSGHQWYVKLNSNSRNAGGAMFTAPPVTPTVAAPLTLSLAVSHDPGGSLVATWTEPVTPAGTYLQIFATPNVSPGISYIKNKLRMVQSVAHNLSPYDFTLTWKAAFKNIPLLQGQKIFILGFYVDQATGATSAGLIASAIVS